MVRVHRRVGRERWVGLIQRLHRQQQGRRRDEGRKMKKRNEEEEEASEAHTASIECQFQWLALGSFVFVPS